jgi:hypothetical protein
MQLSGEVPAGLGTTYPLVGPLAGSTEVSLTIGLPLIQQSNTPGLPPLATFVQQVSNPTSPTYRQYLTPTSFAAAYGPSTSDYTALQNFVTANGLTVSSTSTSRALLGVTGTAAAIENAFFVTLNVYKRPNGTTFYAPANQPSLNLTLTNPILHITGFDTFAVPTPAAGTSAQDCPVGSTSAGYFGQDLRSLYLNSNCAPATCPSAPPAVGQGFGLGQTVALFELDSYNPTNVSTYESGAGLSPASPATKLCSPNFPNNVSQVVVPAGGSAGPLQTFATTTFGPESSSGESEAELGMEMVLAMAPQATVVVYEQNTLGQGGSGPAFNADSLFGAMEENVPGLTPAAPPQVITNSWTWNSATTDTLLPQIFSQFVAQGQSLFQASGDLGAYITGGAEPSVPDPIIDSPLMTVVGGTTFGGLVPQEITWNNASERTATACSTVPLAASTVQAGTCASVGGGGFCTGLALPSYQVGVGTGDTDITSGPANTRMIPDVSMIADNLATVTRATSGVGCSHGTSASAALWAGFAALANEQTHGQGAVGFANPQLYFLGSSPSSPFNDIGASGTASNDNYSGTGKYSAVAGYDLATGWGSPSATTCNLETNLPAQSCMPGTSVSALVTGKSVTAYVPAGSYSEAALGVFAVPLEAAPTGIVPDYPTLPSPVKISTGTDPVQGVINTCGGNSQTGTVVCTSNGNTVYLINGLQALTAQTATALPSDGAATGAVEQFSGGTCQTCNVAIDPVHNLAYLSIATGTDTGEDSTGAAFQVLNLATNTFGSVFQTGQEATSEDIVVDPLRFGGLVLSPNEGFLETAAGAGNYQLLQTSTGSVFNFALTAAQGAPTVTSGLDSAAEDCESGIALATDEFTDSIFLVDLNQVTFSGTSWSAGTAATPGFNFVPIPQFAALTNNTDEAGTAGVAVVAQGTHVGVVAGEFGGGTFLAIALPTTSGTGTPVLKDYVVATIPSTPTDNLPWSLGADPHTLTAYMSPNSGQPYAVFEDDIDVLTTVDGARTFLAVVDLNALLARPRSAADSHQLATPLGAVDTCTAPSTGIGGTGVNPAGCIVRFIGAALPAGL